MLSRAVRKLTIALVRYFIDCVCAALNPPCPDCNDTSVLLGCVEVDDCRVLDLCNMSRRFVLTPQAMRYWLPPLGWIGDLQSHIKAEILVFQERHQAPQIGGGAVVRCGH